jgi:uncharacterized membrane protein YbhN (UPF0104 family)
VTELAIESRLAGGVGRLERLVLPSAILFGLVFFGAALFTGGHAALAALQGVPVRVFALMLCLSSLNYVCRAARWLLFSHAMRLHVPRARNALYYVAGFAMTTTPGKLGEALRLWFLRRGHGCRYADTVGLLIADRLWDAVAMASVLCASVAWLAAYLWVSFFAAAIVGGVTLLCLKPSVLLAGINIAARWVPGRRRMFATGRRALRKMNCLARPDIFGLGLLLGLIGWFSEGISLFVLLHALHAPVGAGACVFIFAFSMIVGAISVLPGGLGSTEATIAGLLALQGVPVQTAILATAVVRVTTLWFAVCLGMIALPVAMRLTDMRLPGRIFVGAR